MGLVLHRPCLLLPPQVQVQPREVRPRFRVSVRIFCDNVCVERHKEQTAFWGKHAEREIPNPSLDVQDSPKERGGAMATVTTWHGASMAVLAQGHAE